ncbi:ATP synthase F1 subunit gamma [Candidatus Kaiserbacteria bacterium]|nr:ATP synthase F1 subunit gamma [Candidatus Kaiserbacteria bacterium]
MAGLKQIKTKIVAMKKSQTVTKAMEAVSAAKMRKAQQTALRGRAYARAAASVLSRVSGAEEHPLMQSRPVAKAIYVVITSDKGLAGGLNSSVLRAAHAHMTERGLTPQSVEVVALGKKAEDYFGKRGFSISKAANAADLAERFAAGEADAVFVAYQNFVSTFEQRPTVRQMFPLTTQELVRVVEDIVPARGLFAQTDTVSAPASYTIEPGESEVLDVLLPRLAQIILHHALLESQASEHSARMVAMKSASDKAGEKQEELTLSFNKARQAAITREVSEIIGGMEAIA